MPTAEERLSLVLEASDKATAILQNVRKEIAATRDATGDSGKNAKDAGAAFNKIGESREGVHLLAREMTGVAFSINEARLGSKAAVLELAGLAGSAAETSGVFAEWAPFIGGAVALLGTALALIRSTKDEQQQIANFQQHTQGKSLDYVRQIAAETRGAAEHSLKLIDQTQVGLLQKALGYLDLLAGHATTASLLVAAQHGALDELTIQTQENQGAVKILSDKERAEQLRLLTLHDQTSELITQRSIANAAGREQLALIQQHASTLDTDVAAARSSLAAQNASVVAMFRRRDESGKIVALTQQEVAERTQLLGLNRAAYAVAVQTATARAAQRVVDARFDIQARTAAIVMETQLQSTQKTTIDQQRLAADIAYQRESEANKRSGASADERVKQEARIFGLYQAQLGLIDAIAARQERTAHADRLASSDNLYDSVTGRLEQIKLEKDAQIAAGISVAEAQAASQQKIRQLYQETARAIAASLQSVADITKDSYNGRTKAAFNFVKNLRAVELGYEAAYATVQAFKEGAASIASFAGGNLGAGALHAAAAVKFAATAVVAANEAGGGSTSGGNAGGGGSASGAGATFQPTGSTSTSQPLQINLYTLHGSDPTLVQSIAFELQKGELLKRPALATPPAVNLGASVGRAA